jgi:hypothetical protein
MCCWGRCTCEKRLDSRDAPLFTVLLVHVVAATSATALQDSDLFALALVQNFFRKYTKIDPGQVDEHVSKFKNLEVDSRLEIAFKSTPKGFQAPSYKVFTNENPRGTVVFDVETRIVQRCITPGCTYHDLEIERTDFLSHYCGELSERKLYSEPSVGTPQASGHTPPYRYSTFPRQGEYMVPRQETYKIPTNREVESPLPEYANLQ